MTFGSFPWHTGSVRSRLSSRFGARKYGSHARDPQSGLPGAECIPKIDCLEGLRLRVLVLQHMVHYGSMKVLPEKHRGCAEQSCAVCIVEPGALPMFSDATNVARCTNWFKKRRSEVTVLQSRATVNCQWICISRWVGIDTPWTRKLGTIWNNGVCMLSCWILFSVFLACLTYLCNSMLHGFLVHAAIIANMPCKRAAHTKRPGSSLWLWSWELSIDRSKCSLE